MKQECENCFYWVPEFPSEYNNRGLCKRHAPISLMQITTESVRHGAVALWPWTDKDDICGDFEWRPSTAVEDAK